MFMYDDFGSSLHIVGYAVIWNSLSEPFSDGHRKIIGRDAFASILDTRTTVQCLAHHDETLDLGEALIWADNTGLAFRSAPLVATVQNSALLGSVVSGSMRGVSWSGEFEMQEASQGAAVRRIKRVICLGHIGPVGIPQFTGPGCWASYEDIYRLPQHLQMLAQHWEVDKPKGTPLHRAVDAKLAARRRPATAATALPRARVVAEPDLPFQAYAGEPPRGFSLEQWEDFAFREAAARRAMRPPRRARQ